MIMQTWELANGPTCLPAVYQHLNYLYYKNQLGLNKTKESEPGRVSMTLTMLGRDLMCIGNSGNWKCYAGYTGS